MERLPLDPAIEALESIDEINTAAFPFGGLDSRQRTESVVDGATGKTVRRKVNTLRYFDSVSMAGGGVMERSWTLAGNEEYGLPTSQDEPVWLSLLSFAREQGLASQSVSFTLHSLVQRCGWADEHKSYLRARTALARLVGTTIYAERTWTDAASGVQNASTALHLLEGYTLVGSAANPHPTQDDAKNEMRGKHLESRAKLGDEVWASIVADNHKPLPLGTYLSLDGAVARRLYRYLDLQRHLGHQDLTLDLRVLAYERLGMSRDYAPSQIKRLLDPAHEELLRVGLLRSPAEYGDRGYARAVTYRMGHADEEFGRLVELLTSRGVTAKVAADLVMAHRGRVEEHVEAYDAYGKRKTPARLVAAIRDGYTYLAPPRPRAFAPVRPKAPVQAPLDLGTALSAEDARRTLGAARVARIAAEVEASLAERSMSYRELKARGGEGAARRLAVEVEAKLIDEALKGHEAGRDTQ